MVGSRKRKKWECGLNKKGKKWKKKTATTNTKDTTHPQKKRSNHHGKAIGGTSAPR